MPLADPLPGRDLAAFVMAVENGTIQGAADALQLTQSAATKRIQGLERRLGSRLLERGAYGVRPTEAGRLLYPAAREALSALRAAEEALLTGDGGPLLAIHASRTIGEALLPSWLASFQALPGSCRISVAITNSEEVVSAIRRGEAEIGFVEGPAGDVRGLRELLVGQDRIRVVVGPTHPWARRRAVRARELAGERFITRERGSGTRAVALEALAAAGITLRPALEVSSTEGIKRAVAEGGFALLSEHVVAGEVARGALARLAIADFDMGRTLRAVCRRRPGLQGPARRFWRMLERNISPATRGL